MCGPLRTLIGPWSCFTLGPKIPYMQKEFLALNTYLLSLPKKTDAKIYIYLKINPFLENIKLWLQKIINFSKKNHS